MSVISVESEFSTKGRIGQDRVGLISFSKQKYILPLQSLISVASAESEFSMRGEEARTGPMSSAVQARPKEFSCD